MAVTENQIIKRQDGERRSYPVKASTKILDGTLVYLTAGGYADDDTATGVNGFIGIANGEADNTNGSDGDINVEVWTGGDFVLVGAGTYSQANVGDIIYGDDNYVINTSIGSTSVPIGKCVGFVSATKLIVEIEPVGTGALPVAPITTITHSGPASADYAIQDLTSSSPFGFVTKDEGNSVLSVIRNLQIRVAELEARRA